MDPRDIKADAIRLGLHAAMMKELIQTPMWSCYGDQLEGALEDYVNRLVIGDKEQFEYLKGVIAGLRLALNIPNNIILWAERANQN